MAPPAVSLGLEMFSEVISIDVGKVKNFFNQLFNVLAKVLHRKVLPRSLERFPNVGKVVVYLKPYGRNFEVIEVKQEVVESSPSILPPCSFH